MSNRSFHYLYLLHRAPVTAREEYKTEFGVAIDDPSIIVEFERCLRDQLDRETIEIPERLAIAIALQPRSKGRRGAPPAPRWVRRQTKLLVRMALTRWKTLKANGARDPKQEAAEQIIAECIESGDGAFEFCGIRTAESLAQEMRERDIPS